MAQPSFFERLVIAWRAFFQLLGDARLAFEVRECGLSLPEPAPKAPLAEPQAQAPSSAEGRAAGEDPNDARGVLLLLSALQREGRFVDFVEQDITAFGDAEVGQVARVVHEGCRRALHTYVRLEPLRGEPEGQAVVISDVSEARRVKLTGNVQGTPPFRGILRHKGWLATSLQLPEVMRGADLKVLAPAEVEL